MGQPPIEYPASFHAADDASGVGQRSFVRATAAQLVLLSLASLGGVLSLTGGDVDLVALAAAGAFILAGSIKVWVLVTRPHDAWYQGRAAAESAKSLAWRYAVGGAPFPRTMAPAEADELLITRLREILTETVDLPVSTERGEGDSITPAMRSLRAADLGDRISAYETQRVIDQRRWYSEKAQSNQRRYRRWSFLTLGFEAYGAFQALGEATGIIDAELLGVAAAVTAAATAWVNTKDYRAMATRYSVAAHELAAIKSLIPLQESEDGWAAFVDSAEQAISREHTTWMSARTPSLA